MIAPSLALSLASLSSVFVPAALVRLTAMLLIQRAPLIPITLIANPVSILSSTLRPGLSTGLDTEMFRTIMSSLWSERYTNLTTKERQGVHAAVEMQPEIADPHRVLQALKLAHKQIDDVSATADGFPTMETFDLDNLDEVAKVYDELCQKCKDEEESKMASLSGLVSNSASIASDTTRSANDRLAAELDIHNFNIHSKVIVPLTSCLRQVQLFNIEKKFGFVDESYQALDNDDRKRRGEDAPAELPLTFRQKLNNPFKPAESAPKPSRKKEKKDISSLKALAELRRSYKATIKEIQSINKSISDAEDSIKPPSVAPSFTYADVPVPKDIPDHIRQRFLDAEYSFNEVLVLQEVASKQLTEVRSAFVAWYSASHEVWYVSPKIWGHETLLTEKLVWLCDTTLGLLLWCKEFLLT